MTLDPDTSLLGTIVHGRCRNPNCGHPVNVPMPSDCVLVLVSRRCAQCGQPVTMTHLTYTVRT